MTPACSREHKKFHRAVERGEERLHEYVNARSIMGILDEHHKLLKKLNTQGHKLSDKIFDYFIPLSTDDEDPSYAMHMVQDNSVDAANVSAMRLNNTQYESMDDVELTT
jgi:glutamate mutase epsilon subunit